MPAAATSPLIRILVAEDHPVVREGLIRGLEGHGDLQIVAAAATVEEAVEAFADHHPDVVVSDYRMAGGTASDLINQLRDIDPAVRVLVLSAFDEQEFIVDSMSVGAHGYVSKTTSMADLAAMIRRVATGQLILEGATAAAVVAGLRTRSDEPAPAPAAAPVLSAREVEVLAGAANGLTNREIADRLGLSDLTVKTHLSRIFSKLGARDRASAVSIAVRSGMI